MIEARLTGLDRAEALAYLGVTGAPDGDLSARLDRAEALIMDAARPRAVWRLFAILPDGTLAGTGFAPAGEDIRAHLAGCGQAVLMAATLGAGIDGLLRRTQAADMALAVVLDACAGAAIENVCDNLCADLAGQLAPRHMTGRFSPGYGDMPLAQQGALCRVLDVGRRIGVSLTPGGLMVPQKTVTALVGISETPVSRRTGGCAGCEKYEGCVLRGEGRRCGG